MFKILIVLYVMLDSARGLGRQVSFGSETETVTIAGNGQTIFRFHEPVKTISQASSFVIKPADENSPDYSVLTVTPRFRTGSSLVSFILASGSILNVKIMVVPNAIPEKTDTIYDFTPTENLVNQPNATSPSSIISELDLMKAMIRSDKVAGYALNSISRGVNTGQVNVKATLLRVYNGPRYNGYVFKIENTSKDKSYRMNLDDLTLGQPSTALLSQVDKKTIPPGSATYLRIVAKPTSVYYNINLPVAPIKNK